MRKRRMVLHPFPGLVLEEGLDDGVHGVDVPGLVHEVDPSEPGREAVLRRHTGRVQGGGPGRIRTSRIRTRLDQNPVTCRPSIASFRMLGVSLDACLKEKLLQSMMSVKPLICSSGFSIRTSRESRMARRMSMKEFLQGGGADQPIDRSVNAP